MNKSNAEQIPISTRLRLHATARRLLKRISKMPHDINILEIGYGCGLLLNTLHEKGYRNITGLDKGGGRPAVIAGNKDIRFIDSTIEDAGLENNAYDLVIIVHMLEHVKDPMAALVKIRACLRPGGMIYAVTPDTGSLSERIFGKRWFFYQDESHCSLFDSRRFSELLGAAGFKDIMITRPVIDSLTAEARSIFHGEPKGMACAIITAMTILLFLPLRVVVPLFRPTIEATAVRP